MKATTIQHSGQSFALVDLTAQPGSPSSYDRFAWLYDWVVGSTIYHYLTWGVSPSVHDKFARRALEQNRGQMLLDAGSGSLLFTARAYRQLVPESASLTLYDASPAMLARGLRRLGRADRRFRFLRGDLRALPFEEGAFDTIFHFGVLHCLERADVVLAELERVLAARGKIFLSCLIQCDRRGDAFLERLHRAGHVATPRTETEVQKLVEGAGLSVRESKRAGSFLFLTLEKSEFA